MIFCGRESPANIPGLSVTLDGLGLLDAHPPDMVLELVRR